jgi:hypothetical protein
MDALVVLLTLLLLAGVLLVISAPLRARATERRGARETEQGRREPERAALEAEREAKYREIRDAELDYRTGKLSREDYEAVDADLRREAIAILDSLERARSPSTDRPER